MHTLKDLYVNAVLLFNIIKLTLWIIYQYYNTEIYYKITIFIKSIIWLWS